MAATSSQGIVLSTLTSGGSSVTGNQRAVPSPNARSGASYVVQATSGPLATVGGPSASALSTGPNPAPGQSAPVAAAEPSVLRRENTFVRFLKRTWVGNIVSALCVFLGFLTLGLQAYSSAIQAIYAKWSAHNDAFQSCIAASAAGIFSRYCNDTIVAGVIRPPLERRSSALSTSAWAWLLSDAVGISLDVTLTLTAILGAFIYIRPRAELFPPVHSAAQMRRPHARVTNFLYNPSSVLAGTQLAWGRLHERSEIEHNQDCNSDGNETILLPHDLTSTSGEIKADRSSRTLKRKRVHRLSKPFQSAGRQTVTTRTK